MVKGSPSVVALPSREKNENSALRNIVYILSGAIVLLVTALIITYVVISNINANSLKIAPVITKLSIPGNTLTSSIKFSAQSNSSQWNTVSVNPSNSLLKINQDGTITVPSQYSKISLVSITLNNGSETDVALELNGQNLLKDAVPPGKQATITVNKTLSLDAIGRTLTLTSTSYNNVSVVLLASFIPMLNN